jgi:hypothetical protein
MARFRPAGWILETSLELGFWSFLHSQKGMKPGKSEEIQKNPLTDAP